MRRLRDKQGAGVIVHVDSDPSLSPEGNLAVLREAASAAYARHRAARGLDPLKEGAELRAGATGPVLIEQGGQWRTLYYGGRPAPSM